MKENESERKNLSDKLPHGDKLEQIAILGTTRQSADSWEFK